MAPVAGRPFLAWLLDYLATQGIRRAILSVGYKHEAISAYFGRSHGGIELLYCIEATPLGTGGAIRESMRQVQGGSAFVLNGDTMANVDYPAMYARHSEPGAGFSMALGAVTDASRYGLVEVVNGRVSTFREKSAGGKGLINLGVYLAKTDIFSGYDLPERFSFEQDFMNPQLARLAPVAFVTEGYFIDIGVPEDFQRAQTELPERFARGG
jgi:D-glycero-alpha-D-manno-heptose 1-phosphate guanylyltransferase